MSRKKFKLFELSEEQLKQLLNASAPVRCMKIGSYVPRSPQQNANDAWASLGREMGFKSETVRPASGKGDRFFTAEPVEGGSA